MFFVSFFASQKTFVSIDWYTIGHLNSFTSVYLFHRQISAFQFPGAWFLLILFLRTQIKMSVYRVHIIKTFFFLSSSTILVNTSMSIFIFEFVLFQSAQTLQKRKKFNKKVELFATKIFNSLRMSFLIMNWFSIKILLWRTEWEKNSNNIKYVISHQQNANLVMENSSR